MFKVLKDCLPVYCSEKLYEGVGEIVCNMQDWDELTFYPKPPDDVTRRKFSTPYNVKICTESVSVPDGKDTAGNDKFKFVDQERFGTNWHVFDKNLQKIELGKYD
jgi:hypothetical protein